MPEYDDTFGDEMDRKFMFGIGGMATPKTIPTSDKPSEWCLETVEIINDLTPDIQGKAFDPGWFLLQERLEEAGRKIGELEEARDIAKQWCDIAHDMLFELRKSYGPGVLKDTDGVKAIRELTLKATERCCQAVCPLCRDFEAGVKEVGRAFKGDNLIWWHYHDGHHTRCAAESIRARIYLEGRA